MAEGKLSLSFYPYRQVTLPLPMKNTILWLLMGCAGMSGSAVFGQLSSSSQSSETGKSWEVLVDDLAPAPPKPSPGSQEANLDGLFIPSYADSANSLVGESVAPDKAGAQKAETAQPSEFASRAPSVLHLADRPLWEQELDRPLLADESVSVSSREPASAFSAFFPGWNPRPLWLAAPVAMLSGGILLMVGLHFRKRRHAHI